MFEGVTPGSGAHLKGRWERELIGKKDFSVFVPQRRRQDNIVIIAPLIALPHT